MGGRVLLVLNMSARKGAEPAGSAFIPFMKCMDASTRVNKALGSICIILDTDDEVFSNPETQANSKRAKCLLVGEWLGVEPFVII